MANNDKSNGRSWIREHQSPILIFGLLIGGSILAAVGTWLETEHEFFGKFLTEISLALLVGAIVAVFLSIPDVVDHLSDVLGRLFTADKITDLLSPAAREKLMVKLVQERLGAEVVDIEQNLFAGLTKLTDDCLRSVHLQNFYVTTDFGHHPNNANFLSQKTTVSFRILTRHLERDRTIRFPYRYSYRVVVPLELSIALRNEDFLLTFALTVDGKKLGEPQVSRETKDTMCAIKFEFEKEFDLTSEETSVALNYTAAALEGDNTSLSRVRYPTRGFAKTIHYTKDFEYDCLWFTSIGQKIGGPLNGSTSEPTPEGITTRRDNWVLPGEGVAIFWSPKHNMGAPVVKTHALTR
jgi:hypothetical protein